MNYKYCTQELINHLMMIHRKLILLSKRSIRSIRANQIAMEVGFCVACLKNVKGNRIKEDLGKKINTYVKEANVFIKAEKYASIEARKSGYF